MDEMCLSVMALDVVIATDRGWISSWLCDGSRFSLSQPPPFQPATDGGS